MRVIVLLVIGLFCAQILAAGYGQMDEDESGRYKSAGGARYKYDLNRPVDKIRYETDYGAQLRDEIDGWTKSPSRELQEEIRGQRGGGVYR